MLPPYRKLALISAVHLVVMFLLTYALLASGDHFYPNVNRLYMAILMVAPMVVIMLTTMRSMFQNARLNRLIIGTVAVLFLLVLFLARSQTPVGNGQFLRSMIPHHSSAILMCERAGVTDPEIDRLCRQIIRSQKEEIAQMQAILARE